MLANVKRSVRFDEVLRCFLLLAIIWQCAGSSLLHISLSLLRLAQVSTSAAVVDAPVAAPAAPALDWEAVAAELDSKSPLEIMDHALATFGDGIAIAFSVRGSGQAGQVTYCARGLGAVACTGQGGVPLGSGQRRRAL